MAFFKLRKAAGEPQAPAPAPESVDALRRRARYRLAGAALLVLAGVIGFPLLFDNQPRPIAVDIPIDIPDKAKAKPLAISPAVESKQAVASAPDEPAKPAAMPDAATATKDSKPIAKEVTREAVKELPKEEVIISSSKPAAKPQAQLEAKAETKAAAKPVEKPAEKTAEKPADKAADKPADKAAAAGRFIVQFGAFTDSARAREARMKVEKTGLKTYAQVVEGAEGKKFRVRVGPFEKRSDAEKAAEKIKKLDLPAAILGL
jgi:DedD protein